MKLKVRRSKVKRLKKVGFRTRSKTTGGRKVIKPGDVRERVGDLGKRSIVRHARLLARRRPPCHLSREM